MKLNKLMDNIVDEFESSKSFDSSDEEQGDKLSPTSFKKSSVYSYSNSSTMISKETNFHTIKSKDNIYVNSRIFAIDNRWLCKPKIGKSSFIGVSKVENKYKNELTLNKGQLVRLVRHWSKHHYWAVHNSRKCYK